MASEATTSCKAETSPVLVDDVEVSCDTLL
uniref:Skp1_POZ domain-containing protein n=1 Tax=Syphacia muris TaxID=451379 RepID=A0A0N5ACR3_9BILA